MELDRVVPPSGNLWLAGQQIWLGPALAGRTVRLWAGLDRVHVLLDGYRVKTLPSRLDARDLARLAAAGALPAGPPPLPAASGDVIEVERTVNASGNVSLGDHVVSVGLLLAGQRVTLRLPEPLTVTRRVSVRGAIMIGGQRIQVGLPHARKTAEVTVEADTYQITVEPGITITITAPRTTSRDIKRHKASNYQPG